MDVGAVEGDFDDYQIMDMFQIFSDGLLRVFRVSLANDQVPCRSDRDFIRNVAG